MCAPPALMAGASFAQGAFGAFQGAAAAKARNRAAIQNYEYQLEARKNQWYQQLSVWGAKRNKYHRDMTENDLAAMRGYSQAQVGLNDVFAQAAQNNETALIKYLQGSGKMMAAGRTGRSVARLNTLELGQLERNAGRNIYKLTRSREAYKQNVENIRAQQISNRSKISSAVAFAPVPDLAPPPPQLENQSAMPGLIKAGLGAAMTYGMSKLSTKVPGGGGKDTNPFNWKNMANFSQIGMGVYDSINFKPVGGQPFGQVGNDPMYSFNIDSSLFDYDIDYSSIAFGNTGGKRS